MNIPFHRSIVSKDDEDVVLKSLRSGHTQGDGFYTKQCELWLQENLQCPRALLTSSGTDALEMAMLLVDIKAGDEVIMPSFTFVSTANAVVLRGATPVFVDIRNDTLNLDENLIEAAITSKTKAILPVHYAGVSCDMDRILSIAENHNLQVIEDAAHSCCASYSGRPLGSFGRLSALSFHETKNLSCGEGGALLINDHRLIARAEILRDKGTNRKAFLRGEVDRYTWMDVGSSFLPSDTIAALLWSQFQRSAAILRDRLILARRYTENLYRLSQRGCFQLPFEPSDCTGNAHLFFLLLPDEEKRSDLQAALHKLGIQTSTHYVPLHSSPAGQLHARVDGKMTVTERVASTILRLPLYPSLSLLEQDRVIEAIHGFYKR
ncbi:MAG: dTDP-4-amino-4,6-dideoxygalactose transaminase [Oligoflexus sp.]|nr:dTDP-4-amino-4,6-dideoxygalactose transaminase [Oligoflexus sp.]